MTPLPLSARSGWGADRPSWRFVYLAFGALELARLDQRSVEFVGEPRAIDAERLNPDRQLILVAIGFATALHRALQCFKRRHQPPRRGVDFGESRLGVAGGLGGTIAHEGQRAPSVSRPHSKIGGPASV